MFRKLLFRLRNQIPIWVDIRCRIVWPNGKDVWAYIAHPSRDKSYAKQHSRRQTRRMMEIAASVNRHPEAKPRCGNADDREERRGWFHGLLFFLSPLASFLSVQLKCCEHGCSQPNGNIISMCIGGVSTLKVDAFETKVRIQLPSHHFKCADHCQWFIWGEVEFKGFSFVNKSYLIPTLK